MADEQDTAGLDLGGFEEFAASLAQQYPDLFAAQQDELPRPIARYLFNEETGQVELSDTPGLVNSQNRLELNADGNAFYYEPEKDATALYYSMDPEKRQDLLDILDSKGIATGTYDRDIRAIAGLLYDSNLLGKTHDVTLRDYIEKIPDKPAEEPARVAPIRVTSSADLRKVGKTVSKSVLGREFNEQELNQWVASFQGRQVGVSQRAAAQSGGVIEGVPTASVAAEEFARQIAPTEAKAYDYLGYANKFFNGLGRL